MSAIKMFALPQNQNSGKRKTSDAMSAELSPDSKCPICLDIFNNISYLDLCLHKFCFRCIQEWSKNKAECPLCKQPFNSIYHTIKSEQDFKKYDLKPSDTNSFGTYGGVRFRYRTTLTGVHRQMQGRTTTPPQNGIIFEASANPRQPQHDRYVRRIMMKLAAKRRAASEGRAVQNVREQEMINFRKELYRQCVRVQSVRDSGRSRDISAEFYRRNPACLHRLVPWLKRELMVLYGAHGSLVNIIQHIIMSRITHLDLDDSAIQEELRPFLQGCTEHFLHEFISFAKSPFNMEAYDQHAVYDFPAPSSSEDGSSNSSVIAISEDEEHLMELDPPGNSTVSTLSHSMWDDETPGPSYSTRVEQGRKERLSLPDSDSDSSLEDDTQPQHLSSHNQKESTQDDFNNDECFSSDSDDCVIVGFVKPTAERTPELVKLSSDSSDDSASEVPHLPQHIRFISLSPPASQSSARSDAGQLEKMETDSVHQSESKERCKSSASGKQRTRSKSERKNRGHKDKNRFDGNSKSRRKHYDDDRDRNRRRRSRSGEHRHSSRSPPVSHSSGSALSRENDYSYSSSRVYTYSNYKRRDCDWSHSTSSQSFHSQSYNYYSNDKDDRRMPYTQSRSHYYSRHSYSGRHSYSRSRSRSRESRRQGRERSRSKTYSSNCSPSVKRKSHHDKPGGKRKYKTRHLEEPHKNTSSSFYPECDSSTALTKHKKKSKDKHHKKSKEESAKSSRSLSMEPGNVENSCERKRHHKKKKKHKKKSKRHRTNEHTEKRSPTVITIESDSDYCVKDSVTQASRSNTDNSKNTSDDPVEPTPLDTVA
ncbi:topoisomerase I binding, arginine/serine-rich a [Sphaeramia orbicularis]|uniref:topoisomerase I binding, arginine/serine-rich a n=1 Tax=Sphaeramia orbicularis TaxID=375764 RepID=UPI00117EB820|nr:E3 ubiquitin-protein ligase Topors [Sphaeramia orbicularis]